MLTTVEFTQGGFGFFPGGEGVPPSYGWGGAGDIGGDRLGQNNTDPIDVPDRLQGPGCSTSVNDAHAVSYANLKCLVFPAVPLRRGNLGRNSLTGPGLQNLNASILKRFDIREKTYLQVRFEVFNVLNHPSFGFPNVAPTNSVYAVLGGHDVPRLEVVRWGLVPLWAKDLSIGSKMINARAEGIETKNAYRHAFRKQRCIVPADGFFEWQALVGRKTNAGDIAKVGAGTGIGAIVGYKAAIRLDDSGKWVIESFELAFMG